MVLYFLQIAADFLFNLSCSTMKIYKDQVNSINSSKITPGYFQTTFNQFYINVICRFQIYYKIQELEVTKQYKCIKIMYKKYNTNF